MFKKFATSVVCEFLDVVFEDCIVNLNEDESTGKMKKINKLEEITLYKVMKKKPLVARSFKSKRTLKTNLINFRQPQNIFYPL